MSDFENLMSASKALTEVQRAQSLVAEGYSRHTWSCDLIYSVLVAAMVGGYSLRFPLPLLVEGIALILLIILAKGWARRHGLWVSGIKPKKARWAAIGIGVSMLPLFLITVWGARYHVAPWIPYLTTSLAFVIALLGSRIWRRLYRREMGLEV